MVGSACTVLEKEPELEREINSGTLGKKRNYVKMNDTVVCSSNEMLVLDLGSCVSVILCGMSKEGELFFAANHLFKCREDNNDLSLSQVSALDTLLRDQGAVDIRCIGVFGAGYRERSPAQRIAKTNIMTILETLSIFNLNIELFQTGFSQGLAVFYIQHRQSIIVRLNNFGTQSHTLYEIKTNDLFKTAS